MKKMIFAVVLSMLALPCLGQTPKDESYPVTVHVTRTEVIFIAGINFGGQITAPYQLLDATIDGCKYRLIGEGYASATNFGGIKPAVLKIGVYKAHVVKEKIIDSAQYYRQYQFLLPDGNKLKFDVIGESEN